MLSWIFSLFTEVLWFPSCSTSCCWWWQLCGLGLLVLAHIRHRGFLVLLLIHCSLCCTCVIRLTTIHFEHPIVLAIVIKVKSLHCTLEQMSKWSVVRFFLKAHIATHSNILCEFFRTLHTKLLYCGMKLFLLNFIIFLIFVATALKSLPWQHSL